MIIKRHCDNFDTDVADDVWIRGVAAKSWVAITADRHIDGDYLDVISEARAKLVVLTDNQSGYPQWAASIVASQSAFLRVLSTTNGPLIIRLSRNGSISRVRDAVEVEARRLQKETARIIRAKREK